jgi:hypothetical protein
MVKKTSLAFFHFESTYLSLIKSLTLLYLLDATHTKKNSTTKVIVASAILVSKSIMV